MEIGSLADWVSGLATAGALFWAVTFEKRKNLTILFRQNTFRKESGVNISNGNITSLVFTPVNNGKVTLEIAFSKLMLHPNLFDRVIFKRESKELSTPELFIEQHSVVPNWQVIEQNRSGKSVHFEYGFFRNQVMKFSYKKSKYFYIEVAFVDSSTKIFKKKQRIKVNSVKDL